MEAGASQFYAGQKINSSSTEYKLKAVRFGVECRSNYEAAKKFNVDRKSTKGKLECGSRNRTRLDGARREPFDPLLQKSHLNGSTNSLMVFMCEGK